MNTANNDLEQAEALDSYWERLRTQPSAQPPATLDPTIAALAQQLDSEMRPPEPSRVFAANLRSTLESQAGAMARPSTLIQQPTLSPIQLQPRRRLWPVASALIAASLLVVALSLFFLAGQTPTVNAADLVKKAQDTAGNLANANITAFELVEDSSSSNGAANTLHVWFQSPNRWRTESRQAQNSPSRITVADGQTIWTYDSQQNQVQIAKGKLEQDNNLYGQGDMAAIIASMSDCYQPSLAGEEQIAGRAAYVLDMGPSLCPSASMPDANGPLTLWLDKETYFVLKSTLRDTNNTLTLQTTEVTSVLYNPTTPADTFTFTPPAGATVVDSSVAPAATPTRPSAIVEQEPSTLADIRQRVSYPVFIPTYLPERLTPGTPVGGEQPQDKVEITYHAADGTPALLVLNGPQTCCLDATLPNMGETISLTGEISARYLPGTPESGGPILWWHQDGSYIALSGPNLTKDDLLKIAASMSNTADLTLQTK